MKFRLSWPGRAFDSHQQHGGFELHQHVDAPIDDPKLQTFAILIRRDEHPVAETDSGRRPRNTPEQQAGSQREAHQSDHGFERRHYIRPDAVG